jgi:alanyl-tRNA synthetase
MKSAEIRKSFLDFFAARGHEIVPSSPLIPGNDPTLLFTNAGMVQFKDVFLGQDKRPYKRAASSQRCVRAGGKHNDLENVGYTARHHTFFEMLGNFSFGDYFKEEAIRYAWDYITGTLGLPAEKLWVTVYEEDDEAAAIWLEQIGVDPARFSRLGADSNFWAMGDTGPCGPCSEIFYDHGPDIEGGPPGTPEEDGDRYVEIWNLVFMQFNRTADGAMTPLPKPSVDTGMGLERLAAVLQGVHSNYDIDLFRALVGRAAELTGCDDLANASLRVIADHIRACAFLVVDGVLPSNEGRGYVLRRIIRRAIRHGYQLGTKTPFFWRLVETLAQQMGEAYPELVKARGHVERVLSQEEERFAETLDQGMRLLDSAIAGLEGGVIPGETAFKLYDTYGFPLDLTADIARERGLGVDNAGFEEAMAAQRERARAASRFDVDYGAKQDTDLETKFVGYDGLGASGVILALYKDGARQVDALGEGDTGVIILDETPFYAESGGQVGDVGRIRAAAGEFEVTDTRKWGKAHAHHGRMLRGRLEGGEQVRAEVDRSARQATVLNHSATHLLHAALRTVLGEHVQQKGSLVAPDRLRFDFSHYEPVSRAQLAEIEALVNAQVRANASAETKVVPYEEAVAGGALALFGEKYEDRVRVLKLGDFSMELCGGTHVRRAGDIGLFKIVAESGIASGVRRIEAVTGEGALAWTSRHEQALQQIAAMLKGGWDEAGDKVQHLIERSRQLEKEVQQLQTKLATGGGEDPADRAETVGDSRIYVARLDGSDPKVMRDAVDRFKQKIGSGIVLLGAADGDKVRLVAGVTKDRADRISAVDLVNAAAELVGGKGGGRADLAQAGGSEPARLDEALEQARVFARARLAS